MSRHERLSAILAIVVEEGGVRIDDIVERLGVSAATARRDLDLLAEQQLVTRTRGGASANPTSAQLPLRYRTTRMGAQKIRIARAAARMVRPGDVIGLGGGTTTTEVAREIVLLPGLTDPDSPVTVVTNAVNIAGELIVRQAVRVIVIGGAARARSFELTGPLASLILPQIAVRTLFLGVEGLYRDGAYASHEDEAAVSAALVRTARRTVVVADHTKLAGPAFALICRTPDIDLLITDTDAAPEDVAAVRESGIDVRLA